MPFNPHVWKERTCKYFNRHGSPINGGCPRFSTDCAFLHPEDEDWYESRVHTGRESRRSPSHSKSHDPYSPSRSNSGRRRFSRSPPSPSISYRSSKQRRDSIASSNNQSLSNHDNKPKSLAERLSIAPMSKPLVPAATLPSSQDATALPTPPLTAETTKILEQQQEQQAKPILAPIVTRRSLSAAPSNAMPSGTPSISTPSIMQSFAPPPNPVSRGTPIISTPSPAPPQPSYPPLVQPPPPLPHPPEFMTVEPSTPATELPPEMADLRVKWLERIRMITDSVKLHEQQEEVDEDLKLVQSLMNGITMYPSEAQENYRAQLSDLESHSENLKNKSDTLIQRLIDSDSWPVGPQQIEVEEKMIGEYKSVVAYVEELKTTTTEMSKVLGDMSIKPPPTLGEEANDNNAMDVDGDDGPPAAKRLRLEEASAEEHKPSQKEAEEIFDKLSQIESMLTGFENEVHQHDRDMREEFTDIIENKFQELKVSLRDVLEGQVEFEEGEEGEGVDEALESLTGEVTLTGEQVGELATNVAELIVQSSNIQTELEVARKEHTESLASYEMFQQKLQSYQISHEQTTKRLATLESALKAHMSQPPSPPASPHMLLPPSKYLLQAIEEPITEALREAVKPIIEEFRIGVKEKLDAQGGEIYETLWDKVSVTMELLNVIQGKLKGELDVVPIGETEMVVEAVEAEVGG